MKNLCAKTRKVDKPYEIYQSPLASDWEWRVLKKYQNPENEKKNPYARWFCAVKSPMTYGEWEYGDTYISDILDEAFAVRICPTCNGILEGHPALSRRDNETEICNDCGVREALEDFVNYKENINN